MFIRSSISARMASRLLYSSLPYRVSWHWLWPVFFKKRFVEAGGLVIICYFPFSFDEAVDRQFWKFRTHKSEYQSIMQADPGPPTKYRVFNWGNRNTQLIGGGVIVEAIVYDGSDEIGRWSPEWIEPRPNPSPEDQWITPPSDYPSCKRRTQGPWGSLLLRVRGMLIE